jgi:eukaryotic-like serine/threonine-protein kinase
MALQPGATLGPYEILSLIGVGGMGEVYLARELSLGRRVALKVLPPEFGHDTHRIARFEQEARSASALSHPNVCHVYALGLTPAGQQFIAMEYVEGETLRKRLTDGRLKIRDALDIAIQIASALTASHAVGVVHRDVKPDNVMLTADGLVKVLDFGLAKMKAPFAGERDDAATRTVAHTSAGMIVGTVAYMSPEQAEGKTVDARSDIFSFGSVLYEMVSGQRAFQGDSPLSTLTAVLREEPKPLSDISAGLPRELERVITRCLRKAPERRWQSMADVTVALRELKEESDSGGRAASAPAAVRARRAWAGAAALTLAVAAGVIGAFVWRDRDSRPVNRTPLFTAIPLTTYQGREQHPSFAPDGNSVSFSWNGKEEDNWDIYVKLIGEGSPHRLTTDPAIEFSPAWSPDGSSIAFVRVRGGSFVVFIVPSRGGSERELLEIPKPWRVSFGQILAWSADSHRLVVGVSPSPDGSEVLTSVDVATGETKGITRPPPGTLGDSLPSVSPDGRMLAFVRRSGLEGELYVQPLSAGFAPIGEPRRLGGRQFYFGVAWSTDGRDLFVSSGNTGDVGLWRIPLRRPEQPERLSPPGDDCRQPAVSRQQGRLAFNRANWDENIWRVELPAPGHSAGTPVSLSSSTRSERNAQFSLDRTRIVFESLRSGTQELWVADGDGRNERQLTSFNGRVGGAPAWSPDGASIAFDLRTDNRRGDIYVISARGGAPRRLTTDPADDGMPSWSRDGRSIYFASTRTGKNQVWKMSPRGDELVQVTQHGGTYAKESFDGRYIYYSRQDTLLPTLWRAPVSGGEEVQVVRDMASYRSFAIARDGIYFESAPPGSSLGRFVMSMPFAKPGATIDFLSFATGRVSRAMTAARHAGHGLDVSPDGRTLLFGQIDSLTEDLMLVENFR